jgi:hypothetical protein
MEEQTMQTLHILRSEPDATTRELLEHAVEPNSETVKLSTGDVDWDQLVDAIFAADKVISWW